MPARAWHNHVTEYGRTEGSKGRRRGRMEGRKGGGKGEQSSKRVANEGGRELWRDGRERLYSEKVQRSVFL